MAYLLFAVAGGISAINLFTYGLWLKRTGNTTGFIMTLFIAFLAIVLPAYNLLR